MLLPDCLQIHYGLANDPKKPENFTYGKKTHASDHVDYVIKAQNLSGLADYHNDLKESQYASNVREPLGKGYSRKYQFPDQVQTQQFSFGVPTIGSIVAV